MSSLSDTNTSGLRQFGNMVLGPIPVVAINAASALTVKTTAAINYTLDGLLKQKAILSAVALAAPTTSTTKGIAATALTQAEVDPWRFYTLPASSTCYLVLALDGSANVVTFQGTYDGQDQTTRSGLAMAKGKSIVPNIPDGFVPFGIVKVVTGATTFLPATDALDKASVTFTFRDIGVLPSSTTL